MKFKFTNNVVLAIIFFILISELAGQSVAAKRTVSQKSADQALYAAAKSGDVTAARLALRNGADVNSYHDGGYTPLIMAAMYNRFDLIDLLLKSGARPEVQNDWGESAETKMVVDFFNRSAEKQVTLYRERFAAAASRGKKLAVQLLDAVVANDTARSIALIRRGAYIDFKGRDRNHTPAIAAARNGNIEVLKELVSRGARLDRWDNDGRTALMHAVEQKHAAAVRLLISAGADIDEVSNTYATPLIIAVQNSDLQLVKILLQAGAKVNTGSQNGKRALGLAKANRNDEIAAELLKADPNAEDEPTGLFANFSLKSTLDPKVPKKNEIVRSEADNELIKLVTSGPGHDQTMPDHIQEIQALLQKGADPNTKNDQGQTPLMLAVINKNISALLVLLQAKASVDIQDADGFTALMHAVQSDQFTFVGKLLDGGANKSLKENKGRTAYDIAAEKKGTVMPLYGNRLKP